eukprot:TRINITY_DN2785_c0_g1_i1.p1 TRINITY_DN2785_c0_g1~~TRINITY_DN2785_c0_g1_i1.p1  ORF type:complete len:185 (-),score=29.10 TRINITY_DN2785_c0_g1_i1:63-617(-)
MEIPPEEIGQATTLDEPVLATLWRDVKMVGIKLFHVLIPRGKADKALRDWDLWGPLCFCLILAFFLWDAATQIFVIIWVGAAIVTANALLLGGKINFFQSVCLLGYCVFPMLVAAILLYFIHLSTTPPLWLKLVISFSAFLWSTGASIGFLASMVPQERKALAVYPVFLFYLVLAWLIVTHFTK